MSHAKQVYHFQLRENLKNMSPKFKELALQAGAYQDGDTILTSSMDVALLAQSIVKACVEVIEAGKVGYDQVPAEVALDLTTKSVKEYFGVE